MIVYKKWPIGRPFFDLSYLVWQFFSLTLGWEACFILRGVEPPSAVLPAVALTVDPIIVTVFRGVPCGCVEGLIINSNVGSIAESVNNNWING